MELSRIMVFDRLDAYVCDLDPARILELRSVEEINGEHALTIVTTHQLEKTNRIVLNDGMGIWHEYVITGIVDTHETDQGVVTEYYCVWSIQYDLSCTFVNDQYGCGIVPGHASVMHPALDGLTIALSTTNRWQIGTITVTSEAAASFYRRSGWEAIKTVIEKWGGELQATITVGQNGVVSRAVDLLAHVGASEATRRFDYGHDVASIMRTVSDDVWPCRIVPLGASQETDEGGYTRRPTIESVNDGVIWLQDDTAVPFTKVPDGDGGWEYPTMIVENDTYEEPADLKAWALANITDYTRPKVTYEASVVQLARAGMNAHGVALGDEVAIVDREFGGDGLRISARVVKQECNLLDPSDTVLTIGNVTDKLSGQFSDLSRQVGEIAAQVANASVYQSTAAYLSRLLERLNNEANATGGYTYYTEGQGIRTYDHAVSDPLVGTEASQVTDLRGGNIRFANSKTAAGDWVFKTLIQAGLIATEFLSASNITVGKMQSADGSTWWDLDANDLHTGVFWVVSNGVLIAKYGSSYGVHITPTGGVRIVGVTWNAAGSPVVGELYIDLKKASLGMYREDGSSCFYVAPTRWSDAGGGTTLGGAYMRLGTFGRGIEIYGGYQDGDNEVLDVIYNSDPDDPQVKPAGYDWILSVNRSRVVNFTRVCTFSTDESDNDLWATDGTGGELIHGAAKKWGRLAQISLDWDTKSSIAVPASGNVTDVNVGTLPTGWRPATTVYAKGTGDSPTCNASYTIATNGVITLTAVEGTGTARTIDAGTTLKIGATYLLP